MITNTLEQIKQMARDQALYLRKRAPEMTGTEIIAEEEYIPEWNNERDYTNVVIGAPVQYEGQVYTLLQPHNASYYPNTTPVTLPALWRVKHTTDPLKAKPWVKPTSTSDMYLKDECMIFEDKVYKCLRDTIYSPVEYNANWEHIKEIYFGLSKEI